MFQIQTGNFRQLLVRGAAALAVATSLQTAAGAATVPLSQQKAAPQRMVLPLETPGAARGVDTDSIVLDWRTPDTTIVFDLPPSDVVDSLSLRLSGDPLPGTRRTRIEMSFNGGAPTPLRLDARGFTATLPLDTDELRSRRNRLSLRMTAPNGECLTQADGGWDLDIKRSRVTAVARARSRSVYLGEVETFLAQGTDGPRNISIRTFGDDARALEALAAQGLALRTPEVPTFTLDRQAGDLSVIAGTRADLASVVTDDTIVQGRGSRIAMHKGRPLRLVITGDTPDEVRNAADAFATHALPRANRRVTSPEEMRILSPLDGHRTVAEGRVRIGKLGGLGFSDNWGAGTDSVTFSVSDPQAARARVRLDLEREDFISSDSRVSVALNGRDLGTTVLDVKKIGLDIAVPQGWLRGENTLTVTPDLSPAAGGCAPDVAQAGVSIGARSSIDITQDTASSGADLSRLAAGGGVFADDHGEGTHVLLPGSRTERAAALRMLGKLARSHGGGLTRASYGTNDVPGTDLIAFGQLPAGVDAPKVMTDIRRDVARGAGVAAFPSNERWVAQFAPLRGSSMASAANALTGPAWDDLSGGIARVGRDGETELIKTAYALDMPTAAPTFTLPAFTMPDFDMPELTSLANVSETVREGVDRSVDQLGDSWSRIEIVDLDRLRAPFAKIRLRGRYSAPRAVAERNNERERIAAGFRFKLKRWERRAERKAAELRNATNIPQAKPLSWKWGERNMSIAAMLVMIAFGFSCWFLSTSTPVSRNHR